MSKKRKQTAELIPPDVIEKRIYLIRSHKVMLDSDLAELYGVETRALVQGIKRNLDRFPRGLHVSTDKRGARALEITDCDLQSRGENGPSAAPLRFYRTGGRDALERPSERPSRQSEYRHHASLRPASRAPRSPQGSRPANRSSRAEGRGARREIPDRVRSIHELAADTPKPRRRIGFKPGED